jgi:hypothetical protein
MLYLILKAAISGVIVAIVSETARRSPGLGALIVSLPLVSILGMIWLWRDTRDPERLAIHAGATFWYACRRCRCSCSCQRCCVGG